METLRCLLELAKMLLYWMTFNIQWIIAFLLTLAIVFLGIPFARFRKCFWMSKGFYEILQAPGWLILKD